MAGKQPMDMITYYRLFGMTRQPQETVDVQTFNTNSKHITVAHNKNVSNEYKKNCPIEQLAKFNFPPHYSRMAKLRVFILHYIFSVFPGRRS